jgi:hypothetical protein
MTRKDLPFVKLKCLKTYNTGAGLPYFIEKNSIYLGKVESRKYEDDIQYVHIYEDDMKTYMGCYISTWFITLSEIDRKNDKVVQYD